MRFLEICTLKISYTVYNKLQLLPPSPFLEVFMNKDYKAPAMTGSFISLRGFDQTEEEIAQLRAKAASGDKEWQVYVAEYDISNGVDVEKNLSFLEDLRAQKDPLAVTRLAYLYGSSGKLYDKTSEETEAACDKKQYVLLAEAAAYGSDNACANLVTKCAIQTLNPDNGVTTEQLCESEKWAERAILLGLLESDFTWFCKPDELLEEIRKNPVYKKIPASHHTERIYEQHNCLAAYQNLDEDIRTWAEEQIHFHRDCMDGKKFAKEAAE